jgi:rhodanese-related sulfurtransferase
VEDGGSADGPTPPCSPDVAGVVVSVSVDQLHDRIVAGDTLAVVDVREPGETTSGIIAGALLYPYGSGVLAAEHATLPTDRPLYVICASGSRSALASAFLVDNGHSCVNNVLGGMGAWRSAGYPTVTP